MIKMQIKLKIEIPTQQALKNN